ncbi:acyltransferase [Akkermansiaceae bacterium]|nr:acyltransferase [Akkermansiaceae bacterium]
MSQRDEILDLLRGLSALLVMLGYLRALTFLSFGELTSPNLLIKIFYFSTGLGHQAVMVFFVLSGYFVGGSVMSGLRDESFSWRRYSLARLSRLWVVLIPALFLTLIFDHFGSHWNPEAYAGEYRARFASGPTIANPAEHGVLTGLGNLAFLQTVTIPVFGSNGPLWSLANEFWYYTLFPLIALPIFHLIYRSEGRAFHQRLCRPFSLCQLLMGLILIWWLPRGLLLAGLIWMLGVLVWVITRQSGVETQTRNRLWKFVSGGLFIVTLVASKTNSPLGSDFCVGLAFSIWMPFLLGGWSNPRWWTRLSSAVSDFSYTLYVVHFPVFFFMAAVFLKGHQFMPNLEGFICYSTFAVIGIAISAGMWGLFERNTWKVRRWIASRLLPTAKTTT